MKLLIILGLLIFGCAREIMVCPESKGAELIGTYCIERYGAVLIFEEEGYIFTSARNGQPETGLWIMYNDTLLCMGGGCSKFEWLTDTSFLYGIETWNECD